MCQWYYRTTLCPGVHPFSGIYNSAILSSQSGSAQWSRHCDETQNRKPESVLPWDDLGWLRQILDLLLVIVSLAMLFSSVTVVMVITAAFRWSFFKSLVRSFLSAPPPHPLCYNWTKLWILICKVGPLSVKAIWIPAVFSKTSGLLMVAHFYQHRHRLNNNLKVVIYVRIYPHCSQHTW